jgi:two-component system, chemotaxis family, chemotaxis protein CheY
MKIMIVDDHPGMRAMIRTLFPAPVYEVLESRDGAEAVAEYARFQPEWVLMDIDMGQHGGIEAARKITAEFPAARILMVSNHGGAELEKAAQEAGALALLPKENLLTVREMICGVPEQTGSHPWNST